MVVITPDFAGQKKPEAKPTVKKPAEKKTSKPKK